MHKSYRIYKRLSNQTQIFCWITETQFQPSQGSPLSPRAFLSLDVMSRCGEGGREGHDPWSQHFHTGILQGSHHFHTASSKEVIISTLVSSKEVIISTPASSNEVIGSPGPQLLSQKVTDEMSIVPGGKVPRCPATFSAPSLLCLRAWQSPCCSPAQLEPRNHLLRCHVQHFFSESLLPPSPEAGFLSEIITWEI